MRGLAVLLLGVGFGVLAASFAGAEPARRVVSLNPSLTAILLAIDAGPVLVGVDEFSARQQPSLAALPRVGGLSNPSLEGVVAVEPDLVVLVPSAEQRDFRSQLRDLEIPTLELDPLGFDQVVETIAVLGARVGREEQARARSQAIRATAERMAKLAPTRAPVRTVLVLQRDPLFVVGSGSFVDDMLRMAGGQTTTRSPPRATGRAGLRCLP
jgi:iron complex transport system substrate-binding protein